MTGSLRNLKNRTGKDGGMSQSSYSEIFRENRALIDSGASPVMNALRDRALACFDKYGFPDARCEEYLHTDISQWFAPDWGMNLGRVKLPVNPSEAFRCNVPNLSTQEPGKADNQGFL